MLAFRPVVIAPISGLALSLWEARTLSIPVMLLNASEAEEAGAIVALLMHRAHHISCERVPFQASRGKAVRIGFLKALGSGFTHAVTLEDPFRDSQDLELFLRAACNGPETLVETSLKDVRRVWPILLLADAIGKTPGSLGFEIKLRAQYRGSVSKIALPGRSEPFSLLERIGGRFL